MYFGPLWVAASLLAAQPALHSASPASPVTEIQNNVVSVSGLAPATRAVPSAPGVGEFAPDFTYQSNEYLWQNLHNILEHGPVMLVFGATDEQLLGLERERASMLAHGVTPVAVVDRRDSEAWAMVRRLELGYSLMADPRSTVGEQYGVLDASTNRSQPAWFVIDTAGRVRELAVGSLPLRGWDDRAVAALHSRIPADRTASADDN